MQGGAFDELAIVQISGKGAGRDGVVAPGLRARRRRGDPAAGLSAGGCNEIATKTPGGRQM